MSSHFNEPLFVISVAARLVKMHPQTLRKYEREGLIAQRAELARQLDAMGPDPRAKMG